METLQNMWVGASLRLNSLRSDLANDQRGVTAVEYAVMLVLVAIAIILATPNISSAVVEVFGDLATFLVAASNSL
jgi:Flp pilus assembly pilin Flp